MENRFDASGYKVMILKGVSVLSHYWGGVDDVTKQGTCRVRGRHLHPSPRQQCIVRLVEAEAKDNCDKTFNKCL